MLGLENWRDQLRLADRGQGAGSANSGLRVSGLNPAPAGTVNTNAGGNTGTEGNAGAGGSANGSAGAGTGGGAGPVFRDDAMLNCGQVVELITKSFQLAAVVKDMKGGSASTVVVPQQFAAQGGIADYAQLGT